MGSRFLKIPQWIEVEHDAESDKDTPAPKCEEGDQFLVAVCTRNVKLGKWYWDMYQITYQNGKFYHIDPMNRGLKVKDPWCESWDDVNYYMKIN